MRVLALDIGTKRIGTAVSDATEILATPTGTIERNPEKKAVEKIKSLCGEYGVKTIVAGLPKNMNGTLGAQAEDCMKFVKNFEEEYEIVFEDERLTSRQAEMTLAAVGKKYTKNKGLVDTQSACIILQQYLDRTGR